MAKEKQKVIEFNSYENEIFSAMWPAPFYYKGQMWKCQEQFYQFKKLSKKSADLRAKIMAAYDPYKMKHFGSKKAGGTPVDAYDTERLKNMEISIRESYMQNPHRLAALLSTDKARLSHKGEWDEFWATGKNGKGADQMGILLTKFRDSMRGADPWKVCRAHKLTELKKKVKK